MLKFNEFSRFSMVLVNLVYARSDLMSHQSDYSLLRLYLIVSEMNIPNMTGKMISNVAVP